MWYDAAAMRRLARVLLNAATAVSLVLCIATVVPWVRSYRTTDRGAGVVEHPRIADRAGGAGRHRSSAPDRTPGTGAAVAADVGVR
jgi:hypothetical protein